MADMRLFEPDYQVTELRLIQPLRHLTAKYAAFGIRADFAFAVFHIPFQELFKIKPTIYLNRASYSGALYARRLV